MSASKSLPARPSLDSLRKQAKQLARASAAGDRDALSRVRAQLPGVEAPLTQRNAQLVIAREYGFAGWQELTAEVRKRLEQGRDWALGQAEVAIHDRDVERLKQLLMEHAALLSWQEDGRGLLGKATGTYALDVGQSPERERDFTRAECAELLIDAGAIVTPSVCEHILQQRAKGMLAMFQRKGLLPRTLEFFAAVGDLDSVRAALDVSGPPQVHEAFVRACLFGHDAVAALLLERSLVLDPELADQVDATIGRPAFIGCFVATRPEHIREVVGRAKTVGLWKAFVVEEVSRAAEDGEVVAFVDRLRREPWLLSDEWVNFQAELLGTPRQEIIVALFDLDPAILRRRSPPPSQAIEWAVMHGNTHLLPLLARIWSVPDDLPYAAGLGNLARVKQWFDGAGALRELDAHYPYNDPRARGHLGWEPPTAQHVLDVALAFAVVNRHFDVADLLLERGADVDTKWNSHEPASILHFLVFLPNPYESMQYLIDRGIDMTIKDYRWDSNAVGWARFGKGDEKLAQWLEEAERQREQKR